MKLSLFFTAIFAVLASTGVVAAAAEATKSSTAAVRGNEPRDLQCTLCPDDDQIPNDDYRKLADARSLADVAEDYKDMVSSWFVQGRRGLGKKADVVSNAASSIRGGTGARDLQCTLCPDDDQIPNDDYRRLADAKSISSWFGFGN